MRNMKSMTTFVVLIMTIVLSGCAAKKTRETKVVEKKSDTLIVKTEAVKAPLLRDVLTIPEICKDSVEFRRVFVRDTDTVVISLQNDSLVLDISQKERVISELEQTLQIKESELEVLKSSETTRYKIHWGLVLGAFLAGGVIGSYLYHRLF